MSVFYNLKAFLVLNKKQGPRIALEAMDIVDKKQITILHLKQTRNLYLNLLKDATSYIRNYADVYNYLNKIDILFIVQYVSLAGRRNYADIKIGRDYLDLTLYPDLDINSVKHNPLLTIEDNNLKFNHE